jgi:hypothetical protein
LAPSGRAIEMSPKRSRDARRREDEAIVRTAAAERSRLGESTSEPRDLINVNEEADGALWPRG